MAAGMAAGAGAPLPVVVAAGHTACARGAGWDVLARGHSC